jgi:integral membrane protein
VRNLFSAYRVLAIIVGVLLTVLVFVAVPLKYLPAEGSSLQVTGDHLTAFVGVAHGWIYMVYLAVSFFLSRRARWSLGFRS